MNGCERYELLASLAVDEEATLEEQAELESHLESCPDCRAYFEDIKRLHEVLTPEKIVLPEGFHTRVMDRVRQTEQDRPEAKKVVFFPHWRRWAALAACCAIAALSVWGVRSAGGKKDVVLSAGDALRIERSMPQEVEMTAEDADAVGDGLSVLSEAAPPSVPEKYGDAAKSAAKEGPDEDQPLADSKAELNEEETGSSEAAPFMRDGLDFAVNGGEADPSEYDSEKEAVDAPVGMEAVPSPADGAAPVETEEEPAAPMPALEPEAGHEELEDVPGVDPVEVINAPAEGVLIAYGGGAAQAWVENTLGLEWARGGSYTLSVEQYSDLLMVLLETGEPYSIAPGEGYCLMTE